MGRLRSALKSLVVVLLLVNTVAAGAVAQGAPRQILLDTEVTEIATVHTNSRTFVVYEYDNVLPYANGIEVYADGERVTSADTVDEVFRALARRKATKFEPEARTIERLRHVVNRSQAVQAATDDAIAALNDTLAYRERLKGMTVNDTSAWKVAIERSEALDETFAGGIGGTAEATELRKQLMKIHRSAADLEANAERVLTLLQKRQAGKEINQSDLYRRYDAVYADLKTMKEGIDRIRQKLSTVAEASRTAASQVRSIPEVGDELRRRLVSLADSLETATGRLAETGPALVDLREALPKVATDERYQTELTERWKKRQGAVTKVYATVVEGVILVVAGAIALFETQW